MAPVVKNLPANARDVRDTSLIPGLGRSPGRGHGNPLQYSCLLCHRLINHKCIVKLFFEPSLLFHWSIFLFLCSYPTVWIGLPWWLSGKKKKKKKIAYQCRTHEFDLWAGKIPWKRAWQSTPIFLPGEFHGQRSLASYRPWGLKVLDTTKKLTLSLLGYLDR